LAMLPSLLGTAALLEEPGARQGLSKAWQHHAREARSPLEGRGVQEANPAVGCPKKDHSSMFSFRALK
jgi:hypothetical protein